MTGLVAAAAFFAFVSLGWGAEAAEDEDEDEDDACIPPVLAELVAAVPLVVWRIGAEDSGGLVSKDLGESCFNSGELVFLDLDFCLFGEGEDCLSVDGNRN